MSKFFQTQGNGLYVHQIGFLEGLKWTGPHDIKQGSLEDWLMNWIKLIHKSGDKDEVANYRTIMVSSIMVKLYNTIMEQKKSSS